jgi:hypothetical protein
MHTSQQSCSSIPASSDTLNWNLRGGSWSSLDESTSNFLAKQLSANLYSIGFATRKDFSYRKFLVKAEIWPGRYKQLGLRRLLAFSLIRKLEIYRGQRCPEIERPLLCRGDPGIDKIDPALPPPPPSYIVIRPPPPTLWGKESYYRDQIKGKIRKSFFAVVWFGSTPPHLIEGIHRKKIMEFLDS